MTLLVKALKVNDSVFGGTHYNITIYDFCYSDAPGNHNVDLLRKVVLPDGSILPSPSMLVGLSHRGLFIL